MTKKKDTLLLVNKFYKPEIGGVETVVEQYAKFASVKYNVIVLCVNKKFTLFTSRQLIEDIYVVRCSSLGTFFSMPLSITFPFYLFYYIITKNPIVHSHHPFPLFNVFSIFIPKKIIQVITWHCDIISQKFLKGFFRPFIQYSLNNSFITTTSKILADNTAELKQRKITVIPLSLPDRLPPVNRSNEYFEALPERFALYFGRLVPYKGLDILLSAIKLSSEDALPVVIAGEGALSKTISEFSLLYSNRCIFINRFLSEEEKLLLINKCSFFVLPSISDAEAFGIVQLEAMRFSKPVINTKLNTGVPWVSLHEETGLTVAAGSSSELAAAISNLSKTKYFDFYSNNARKRYLEFFNDEIIKLQYLNFLDGLVCDNE